MNSIVHSMGRNEVVFPSTKGHSYQIICVRNTLYFICVCMHVCIMLKLLFYRLKMPEYWQFHMVKYNMYILEDLPS